MVRVLRAITYEYDTEERMEQDMKHWKLQPGEELNLPGKKITSTHRVERGRI